MFQSNEIITLLLGVGVLLFIAINHRMLRRMPRSGVLLSGFTLYVVGWFCTVAEGVIWLDTFNAIEHVCYALGGVMIVVWSIGELVTRERPS